MAVTMFTELWTFWLKFQYFLLLVSLVWSLRAKYRFILQFGWTRIPDSPNSQVGPDPRSAIIFRVVAERFRFAALGLLIARLALSEYRYTTSPWLLWELR